MTRWNEKEIHFMKDALRLARQGWGLVSPNPLVGAVLVKRGSIIATGWHAGPGQPHAEAMAINVAGKKAKGSELFVNLEPCSHYGRTGPCVDAIIKAGIQKVYYSIPDPHPKASGGAKILEQHGVETDIGLLSEEAIELNQFFLKSHLIHKPFVILKTAVSLDGKIATRTGDSRWISSKVARNFGHHLRSGVDAVLIGRNTAQNDDPELSARPWGKRKMHRQPYRVVLDPNLKLPLSLKLFDPNFGGDTIIFQSSQAPPEKTQGFTERGVKVITAPLTSQGLLSMEAVLSILSELGVQSLLIEPGATLAASVLMDEPIVDLIHIFIAPKFIGGHDAPGMLGGEGIDSLANAQELSIVKLSRKGPDIHLIVSPKNSFQVTLTSEGTLELVNHSSEETL
ncbi:MAG: bifunctional diaminohydroxyphosphoribosylaminopyrimidine deaminase/5-amino-6-(5-phosphoribosylamino)uracil reductase RibD [Deltaproteobacteria bacterium]|jgi:diaminohydroxyphosphoribosylaminopyrimidine deaminase/5-amino-6-(5-phosphoribosylamino)uracil reductase|nr:bifunctional diaminohydroxyphosphoribosylaminopyrimidine deaminase/5-amino-6-(5-phosphoribosylamino)uracil reductase RibD [Deltaproteobacteria bacterium]